MHREKGRRGCRRRVSHYATHKKSTHARGALHLKLSKMYKDAENVGVAFKRIAPYFVCSVYVFVKCIVLMMAERSVECVYSSLNRAKNATRVEVCLL